MRLLYLLTVIFFLLAFPVVPDPNSAPTVSNSRVISGTCNPGNTISIACDATDTQQASSTLTVKGWAGECATGNCQATRSWTSGSGITYYNGDSGDTLTYSSGNTFSRTITINQPLDTAIAATCQAVDSQGAMSGFADAYPVCTVQCVDGTCIGTQYCSAGTLVVQDSDGDGADDRCESFPTDPCSVNAPLDNCNNARGRSCPGCVRGSVANASGEPVENVVVTILGATSTLTGPSGNYLIAPANPGSHSMSAVKNPYTPTVLKNQQVSSSQITTVNFQLGYGSNLCEADCTYTSDSICHPACAGTNGCSFYSLETMNICKNQPLGFRFPYGSGQEVQCCTGTPYDLVKVKAITQIDSSNVVRIVKISLYEGKLVKIVIDVFE